MNWPNASTNARRAILRSVVLRYLTRMNTREIRKLLAERYRIEMSDTQYATELRCMSNVGLIVQRPDYKNGDPDRWTLPNDSVTIHTL